MFLTILFFSDWKGFASEAEIEKLITSLSFDGVTGGNTTLRAAIIFEDGLKSLGSTVSYKIRMMDDSLNFHKDVMTSLFPWLQLPGPDIGKYFCITCCQKSKYFCFLLVAFLREKQNSTHKFHNNMCKKYLIEFNNSSMNGRNIRD